MIKTLGIDVLQVDTTPQHELGAECEGIRGGGGAITRIFNTNGIGLTGTSETINYRPNVRFVYVRADAAIAQYDAVEMKLDETDAPYAVVKTAGATSTCWGICEVANVGAGSYFWLTVHGYVPIANVADAAAQGNFVAPSATAGRLDTFTFTTTAATLAQLLAGFAAGIAQVRCVTDADANNRAAVYLHGN